MSLEIKKHVQQLHCEICGEREVTCLCHHCGRAMCERHQPEIEDFRGHLISHEFTKLGLKGTEGGEGAIHCKRHDHIIKEPNLCPAFLGLLFVVTGLFEWNQNQINGIILSLSGFGLVILALWFFYFKRRRDILEFPPPIPLLGRCAVIKMREEIFGQMDLDQAGNYRVCEILPVEGEVIVEMNLGKPVREQIKKYRDKYDFIREEDIRLSAGFVAFEGPIDIEFASYVRIPPKSSSVIPLMRYYDREDELNHKATCPLNFNFKYRLIEEKQPKPELFPVRLVPTLVPQMGRRVLELEIQWGPFTSDYPNLTMKQIDLLEIRVPGDWCEVECDGAIVGKNPNAPKDNSRKIIWKKPATGEKALKDRRQRFQVEFENEIDLSATIRGQLEMTFKNSFSRISAILLFFPVGTKSSIRSQDIETKVTVEFRFCLASLAYQEVLLIPKYPANEMNHNAMNHKENSLCFKKLIPNHQAVIELTNALCAHGFYVQQAVAEFPRTGMSADRINRAWNITGRHYNGIYPVDFHLILSGEEIYKTDLRPKSGRTKVILTVKGSYFNETMQAEIRRVKKLITFIIDRTFEQFNNLQD